MGVRWLTAAAFALLLLPGCGDDATQAAPEPTPHAETRHERPLPAFEGRTLTGETLPSSALLGRRALLFFFNPETDQAGSVADAVAAVARLRAEHNFQVVGVGIADTPAELRTFVETRGLEFPVIDDSRGRIVGRLGLRVPVALVGVDAEGYVSFGLASFPEDVPDAAAQIESELRQRLRLPALGGRLEPVLGEEPLAPDFEAPQLDGGSFQLSSLRGRGVVLIFFLHTCPHCHAALRALEQQLPALPEATRPELVGVSLVDRPSDVRAALAELDLDFFDVVFDPDSGIRNAFGATGGTPDIFLIDAGGRVVARVRGWRDERDPPLMRMRLARLAGAPVPMLLHQSGYSGNEFCGVCHVSQFETYQLTSHSWAFDTLVRHGADRKDECIACHVVGHGQPGGFAAGGATPHLEGVGCESCHGRGGPHLSPGFVENGAYERACLTCHDAKHSLGFDYAAFLPRVSHAANAELLKLPVEAKRRVLAERAERSAGGLPTDAGYVGSEACRGCHAAEFATWSDHAHARALQSLEAQGKTGEGRCLACHTTGYGRPGGFPIAGAAASHPDLARVGCESCHGPGERHVTEGSVERGSIVSLGDKCDSCVILQICGSCHDDANDPGFEFEVLEKIEAQRHGTIEPSANRTGEAQAEAGSVRTGLLERAFRAVDGRG